MNPRSRWANRFDCGSRFESFLVPSPKTVGRCANFGIRSATPILINA
ncbi:Uncharacterised protein [Mycobacterium tuberculosis]|nr:Uncharacterised protein [Mycobacterium tuberculosis]